MSNYNYPKKAYKAVTATVDASKGNCGFRFMMISQNRACKAGFDSLSELLRVYDAFANSEYEIK